MLSNPEYPEEFSRELKNLSRLVSFTIEVLKLMQRSQSKLIKFSPIFRFKILTTIVTRNDFQSLFLKVREEFMDIIRLIEQVRYSSTQKEMAYFVQLIGLKDNDDTKVEETLKKLSEIDTNCDQILLSLKELFSVLRVQCPRYCFFKDEQMMMLCSLLKFPKSLMGFIAHLFAGVASVGLREITDYSDIDSMGIQYVSTHSQERLYFPEELIIDLSKSADMPLTSIVSAFEGRLSSPCSSSV
jgi:hypothetical protein